MDGYLEDLLKKIDSMDSRKDLRKLAESISSDFYTATGVIKELEEIYNNIMKQLDEEFNYVAEKVIDEANLNPLFSKYDALVEESKLITDKIYDKLNVVKDEVYEFMNDPKRGYDCKWASFRRRGGGDIKDLFNLLVEKKGVWGDSYGDVIMSAVEQYIVDNNKLLEKESQISEVVDDIVEVVNSLDFEKKLVVAKYLNDKQILTLGCGYQFGYFKSPTSCTSCHEAEAGLSRVGLLDAAEFKGGREYKIPSDVIDDAVDHLLEVYD